MLLFNFSKTKDNLIGIGDVGDYFLPAMELLWIWGLGWNGGSAGGAGGIG